MKTPEEYPFSGKYDRIITPQQEEQFSQTICWLKDCIARLHIAADNMNYKL